MDISTVVIINLFINIILLVSFIKYCRTTNSTYKWWHVVLLILFGGFIFTGWFIFNNDL